MADIVGRVFRLALASQHDVVDQRCLRRAGDPLQQAVEIARVQLVGGRQGQVEAVQDGAEGLELVVGWRRMHAVGARTLQPLQLFRGRHVGQDHEFLDQPVAVEALPWPDRLDPAIKQEHLPLRQIKIERAPRLAAARSAR